MGKEFNNNGFDYVDLGLPSGTLWATMNVGANKPSEYGLYFQWGETQGYTYDQVGKDKNFNWDGYKWYDKENDNITKYTSKGEALDLEDDAAHVHMGGDWHIPTPTQIQELIDNTTSKWIKYDGVKGVAFTSKNDTSKSIFIPAAGSAWNGLVHFSGNNSGIWSNMLNVDNTKNCQFLYFYKSCAFLASCYRCNGFQVRGVISK